jgi:spore coat protein A, manganese oxidase
MLNRRKMIRNSALGIAALLASPRRVLAEDSSPLLTPFLDPLRIPPVLTPVVRGKTHYYTLTMRAGLTRLHRNLPRTVIWGFNGMYPGPTIKAIKGHPVVIRQIHQLPDDYSSAGGDAMMAAKPAVHLHGAHTAPEDDGHPRESITPGGYRDYHYPNRQKATTLVFHDHSHEETGKHVYYGMAGAYLIEDPEEQSLGLPKGEYDIPLLIQDKFVNSDGVLRYTLDNNTRDFGVLADTVFVNGVIQPYLSVATRKYRFRIINGSNARIYELQLSSGRPMVQIGTDGGLLHAPLEKTSITLGPLERATVVIDFGFYAPGTKVVLRSCASCTDRTAELMRFDVDRLAVDDSVVPDCLTDWEDLPITAETPTRQFTLNRLNSGAATTWVINGQTFDPNNPPLAQVKLGTVEKWRFLNPTNRPHPIHVHLVQFQILNVNGQPQDPSKHGWKDMFLVQPGGEVTVAARFDGYTGRYLFHCHNLEHEDLGMMADFEVVP